MSNLTFVLPRRRRNLWIATLVAVTLAINASAATYTWDGSVNNWNSPHWTPGPVSFPGAGHAMVVNGGTVFVTDSSTSYFPASITLNGGTLKVTSTGGLFPGTDANTQVITVNAGAVLELDTWFKADGQSLGRLNQSAGRIVVNGGTIRTTGVTGYGRGVTVNAGGATLETTADADWLLNELTDNVAWIYNGNPTLIFTGEGIGRFEKVIASGTGSVIKRGSGKWTLARTSGYSGDTIVEGGILVLRRGSLHDASTVSIANGAILSLRHYEGDVIGGLILGGVTMPPGTYNRSTHPQFLSGSGSLVIGGANFTGTPSLTWFYGAGGDATIRTQISNSMDRCVDIYNAYAYLHGNILAEYNAGVPTAQASFGGPITFGGSRNHRVALHEMGHVFGVGTRGEWGANLSAGIWRGARAAQLIQQIDGPGAVINSDGTHFWPYGLNFDNEGGLRNEICHARMVEALSQDMGLFRGISTISSVGDMNITTGESTGPINVTIGDPGVAAGSLVFHVTSSNPTLVPTNRIVVTGTGSSRTLEITPVPEVLGVALITMTVSGGRDAAMETFVVTVGKLAWNGGSGDWDTVSPNWNGGAATWPWIGDNNDAYFGGTSGVVSVQGAIRVDDIAFASDGYLITNGTLVFDNTPALTVSNGVTATIDSELRGLPGLAKEGTGTLVLTGHSPYRGGIYVNSGALFIVGGSLTEASVVEARNGTLLGGSGSLARVVVRSGAELSPGPEPATMETEGLDLEAGSILTLDRDGPFGDGIFVRGDVALNGTLNVRATGPLVNGSYPIITFTGAQSGNGLRLGTIPAGYSMIIDDSRPGEIRLLVAGGSEMLAIIGSGSEWKYNAAGRDLGTAWRLAGYNDFTWPSGPTQIGYGDGDEASVINTNGGRPQIVYFRNTFTLTAAQHAGLSNSVLSLLRDDGAVVYVNGVEVLRDNMPPAPAIIAYDTQALTAVGGADENAYSDWPIDPAVFIAGENIIAVEVHQSDPDSSDVSFDLRLQTLVKRPGSESRFQPVSLVATGAMWKYFDLAIDQGSTWRNNSFNDTGWRSGRSMLGFGDANGIVPTTVVANNQQWTTYFRHAIHVPDPWQVKALSAWILRDDAAVVYVNGAEIWRDPNLPSTTIVYDTPAIAPLAGASESEWLRIWLTPDVLRAGTNLIAIEVHQVALSSSDLAMNFELNAVLEVPLDVGLSIAGNTLSWPNEGGWFSVFTTTNLTSPTAWTPVTNAAVFSNDQWQMTLPVQTNGQRFFRLERR